MYLGLKTPCPLEDLKELIPSQDNPLKSIPHYDVKSKDQCPGLEQWDRGLFSSDYILPRLETETAVTLLENRARLSCAKYPDRRKGGKNLPQSPNSSLDRFS